MTAKTLNAACSNGDVHRVRELFDSDWQPSQDELDEALYEATLGGHATVAALLLSHGARVTKLAFLGATSNRDLGILQEFLNHGWDINSTEFGSPALRLLVDDETCVRWCLEHGADPNQANDKGVTPLATAALCPSTTVIELLISHGAKLDPSALLSAISPRGQGGVPIMKCLIDHGIDINAPSHPWSSPLHFAVSVAGVESTRLLLDKGADHTVKNKLGKTPVEMADSRKTRSPRAVKVYEMLIRASLPKEDVEETYPIVVISCTSDAGIEKPFFS